MVIAAVDLNFKIRSRKSQMTPGDQHSNKMRPPGLARDNFLLIGGAQALAVYWCRIRRLSKQCRKYSML